MSSSRLTLKLKKNTFFEILYRLLEFYSLFEKALVDSGDISDEVKKFFSRRSG